MTIVGPEALHHREVEELRRRNHLQILRVGLALYVFDVVLSWLGIWGYGGDAPARLVLVALGIVLIVRLQVRRAVSPRWERGALVILTVGMLAHAVLAVGMQGLTADTLLSSGLWLYLIDVYAFYILSAPVAWRLTLAVWALFTLMGGALAAIGGARADGVGAFVQFQGGGIVAIVLASALSGWRRALDAANERAEDAKRESLTDPLTAQPNRRAMQGAIRRAVGRARRSGIPFCLVLVDIDGFKRLNDVHGHQVGDAVLHEIAGVLRGALRFGDELGRWGGEEFMVVATAASAEDGMHVAERLRSTVEAHAWSVGSVTASLGVTAYRPGDELEHLFKRADDALYRAKQLGRNRCEFELARGPEPAADEARLPTRA